MAVATYGVGKALKAATITEVIPKLKTVPYIADKGTVVAKLDNAVAFAEDLATTKMCFVAGTAVLTAGGPRAIETIRPGDLVLSRDEASGEQAYKPVLETVVTRPTRLYHVGYRTAAGIDDELVGTGEHPFFVTNRSGFVRADELAVGDTLRLADGGPAEVTSLNIEEAVDGGPFTTYNFEVADFHTYFVGDYGVWVHNASTLCEKLFSVYSKFRGYGETPEQAFDRVNELISRWITRGRLTADASLKELGDTLDSVVKTIRAAAGKPLNNSPSWNIFTKGKSGDAALNLWVGHWLKHGVEFPGFGPVQYVTTALDTADSVPGLDVLVKTITNRFGLQENVVMNLNNGYFVKQMLSGPETGSLKTFFVRVGSRQNRIDYFNSQNN